MHISELALGIRSTLRDLLQEPTGFRPESPPRFRSKGEELRMGRLSLFERCGAAARMAITARACPDKSSIACQRADYDHVHKHTRGSIV